jgi:hypothetical protein
MLYLHSLSRARIARKKIKGEKEKEVVLVSMLCV